MYKQVSVAGEDFVGLLGLATDRYAILSPKFRDAGVLEVPTIKTGIYGTNLIGLFCKGNSNGLLFPYCVEKDSVDRIKKSLKEHKIDIGIGVVNDTFTALGNLIAANDKAAVVNPEFKDVNVIRDILDVEVVKKTIGGHPEVGSSCVATNKGFLAHPDAEDELKELEDIFKVPGGCGTINFGFPYVGSGLIANSHGYITGLRTSGIELGKIDEALGFLE